MTYDLHVASNLGAYDIILGRDILRELGIVLDFNMQIVIWNHACISMKNVDCTTNDSWAITDPEGVDDMVSRLTGEQYRNVIDAKYKKANLNEVLEINYEHLSNKQKRKLLTLLSKYETLFDGTLGTWKGLEYDIELKEGVKPYYGRPYTVPKAFEKAFRKEIERLTKIGVLHRVNRSEWGAPTFVIPKKDMSIRILTDFRELNKRIKQKPYPLPKIQNLLLKMEGFKYATSLDLNMGYYHITLSPYSSKLCTIVLPWGKYEYLKLPMGLCNSPEIFQEKMNKLFPDLETVLAYIDDLLIITDKSFENNLLEIEKVLKRLQKVGLKVNINKSFFARHELEYLGYCIT